MSEQREPYQVSQPSPSNFEEMRFPDGWLAFRYDPNRCLVEIQRRGQKYYFDLAAFNAGALDKAK